MRFFVGAAAVAAAVSTLLAAPAVADSGEQEIRAVLDAMNSSYNRTDFAGFAAHVCADMLQGAAFAAGWYESRKVDGPTRITVESVSTRGDDAVAHVRFQAGGNNRTFDVDFLREGSQWKACQYHPTQSA
ncbi:transcriptional regulator [Mycolicibacterium flavescens]|uniref:Transcriptional regulator n=1 Tax=Mycolicibacterium flavescens TaxID=1776 RepID=A0A1E3RPB9_MYCFV|nr:transcriptional regulator [Mycolicibacterium flavescens]MCV7278263.1 transcriptional regulator [Mycolicibacterium flavescens]ODQ91694.1 transcriptional regulator [Mycolicibacterium flavescens]